MIYKINNINEIPTIKTNELIIGFFDGVHLGHKKLFDNVEIENFTVLTFNFMKKNSLPIYSLEERIKQLEDNFHPDNIVIIDLEKFNMSANDFINNVLLKWKFNKIIVGEDFKFGSDQKNIDLLKKYFNLDVIPRDMTNDISTTKIKKLITSGKIQDANSLLLTSYNYGDVVIHNTQQARLLGFPTANFLVEKNKVIPLDGVYISETLLNNKIYPSITFIGVPKTFNLQNKYFETHLINYSGNDFYGEKINVKFIKRIDDVKKYPNIDELIKGIKSQVQITKDYFKI